MNYEKEWKQAVVTHSLGTALYWHLYHGTEDNHRKLRNGCLA